MRWRGIASILLSVAVLGGIARADEVRFPDGFRWCVATAAHQIEGGNSNSDWWSWEQVPGHVKTGEVSGAACDSWNRGDEDVRLLSELHVTDYRFSVEWARIEPEPGRYDELAIAHYRREVDLLRSAGIRPMITLHHFTFPQWLRDKGGWEWEGVGESFAAFARLVYTEIAPDARDWVTINEPMVHVLGGYVEGSVPPSQKRELGEILPVVRGLLRAHAAAYHALHDAAAASGHEVRVGMAHHLRTFSAANFWNPLDHIAAGLADDAWNWAIPDALESGRMQFDVLWLLSADEEIEGLEGTQDFIGINYYTGDRIHFSFSDGFVRSTKDGVPKNDLGWDILPEGFYETVMSAAERYEGKPILITENGIADATDQKRPKFILDHLRELSHAIDDGAPVEGYCHWSLMDNFEWNEGFTPRFGLYEMNYRTFERSPRESAILFSHIVQANGFSE